MGGGKPNQPNNMPSILSKADRDEVLDRVAVKVAEAITQSILDELGLYVGEALQVPVAFAARLTGWNEKWIRRNLPLTEAEGQVAMVQMADIKTAIQTRKSKCKY